MTEASQRNRGVAIVTGGASGIGKACVQRLHRDGFAVAVADIDETGATALAGELGDDLAMGVAVDVTDASSCVAMVAAVVDRFGSLDVLHANAGIPFHGNIEDTDEAAFDRVVGVNLKGAFLTARATVPTFKAQRSGTIVFTSSLQGVMARPGFTPYTAAKHGVIGLMKGLALELAPFGIRVNAIAPAATDTPMLPQFVDDPEMATSAFAATIPLGRIATPEDIASALSFLVSSDASFVSGHTLVVDGASTAG